MPGARVRTRADDDLDRAGDRGDLDEADAEQPEVLVDAGRISAAGERRIHEPAAARRQAEEQAGEEHQPADRIGPVGERGKPRKRHVARPQHVRQQQDAHRFHCRHGEQEHHDRAVHGEELVVELWPDEVVLRHRELGPHQQGEHAGEDEEQESGADVEQADEIVVVLGEQAQPARQRPDAPQLLELSRRAGQRIGQRAHRSW
jgi:hypothetical protein